MTSTRMAMGAAVISCVSAAMMTGALAQENTTNGYFNARAGGNHMSATGQLNGTGRQSERPAVSAHAHARIDGNHMMATGQPNGQRENETRSRGERREFWSETASPRRSTRILGDSTLMPPAMMSAIVGVRSIVTGLPMVSPVTGLRMM